MATNTTNYNLIKPQGNEYYNINVSNGNMDTIDEELKKAQDHREDFNNPHGVTAAQLALTSPSSLSIYVSPTGSDDNDGLTADTALLTIAKALTFANPWTNIDIKLADGTYNEGELYLRFCSSITIASTSIDRTKVIVNGSFIVGASRQAYFTAITINSNNMVGITSWASRVLITGCKINGSNTLQGIAYYDGSTGRVYNTEINNSAQAVLVGTGCYVAISSTSGTENSVGLKTDGGIITVYGTTPAATTPKLVVGGGIIIGDNNGLSYETGAWLAKIANYNGNYTGSETIENASYTLIGKMCHVQCTLLVTSIGTGNLLIWGLPFVSKKESVGMLQIMASDVQGAAVKLLLATVRSVSTYAIPHDATNALFTSSMLTVGNRLFFSADYEINQ